MKYSKNRTYVWEPGKFSKCAKFEGSNLKKNIVNTKNAETIIRSLCTYLMR